MGTTELRFKATRTVDTPYVVERGILHVLGEQLPQFIDAGRPLVLITDDNVPDEHVDLATRSLRKARWPDILVYKLTAGEQCKNHDTHLQLIDFLLRNRVHRRAVLLALGGGVVIDTVGYVAASYMRGIDYINIPSTLIAQVDASVGGKVAVNHPTCKNLIGAFWHPLAVFIDPNLLRSLSIEEIRSGLAEVVKVAMIHSSELFDSLEAHTGATPPHHWKEDFVDSMIVQAVQAKIELLMPDPFESDLRRVLNFGHTFAHPIEVMSEYSIRHGYAVSMGMCIATAISERRGLIGRQNSRRLFSLLRALNLPVTIPPYDANDMWQRVMDVRAIRGNNLHYVLPLAIGKVEIVDDLTHQEFLDTFDFLEQQPRN